MSGKSDNFSKTNVILLQLEVTFGMAKSVCRMSYQMFVEKQQHEISQLMEEEEEYITVSKERQGF